MTPRIEKAINIFLDSLNEGTLVKGDCTACAVGNLVANGLNGKIIDRGYDFKCIDINTNKCLNNSEWAMVFCSADNDQSIDLAYLKEEDVVENISATDFTWKELAQIEKAFEFNTKIGYIEYCEHTKEEIRADQINGLEAVVKVMLSFDNQKDEVSEVFTKKAELITI